MERSKYEKKNRICYCFIAVIFACILTGCATLQTIDNSDVIVGNQVAAAKLENTIGELDRATTRSRERLEVVIGDSRKIEEGLSRLEFLFNFYESEVERILEEIDRIRGKAIKDRDEIKNTQNDQYNSIDSLDRDGSY